MADGGPTESMAKNLEQGKGIGKDKSDFKVVGVNDLDRDTTGSGPDDSRGRGRPRKDESAFKTVGKTAEEENKGS